MCRFMKRPSVFRCIARSKKNLGAPPPRVPTSSCSCLVLVLVLVVVLVVVMCSTSAGNVKQQLYFRVLTSQARLIHVHAGFTRLRRRWCAGVGHGTGLVVSFLTLTHAARAQHSERRGQSSKCAVQQEVHCPCQRSFFHPVGKHLELAMTA